MSDEIKGSIGGYGPCSNCSYPRQVHGTRMFANKACANYESSQPLPANEERKEGNHCCTDGKCTFACEHTPTEPVATVLHCPECHIDDPFQLTWKHVSGTVEHPTKASLPVDRKYAPPRGMVQLNGGSLPQPVATASEGVKRPYGYSSELEWQSRNDAAQFNFFFYDALEADRYMDHLESDRDAILANHNELFREKEALEVTLAEAIHQRDEARAKVKA